MWVIGACLVGGLAVLAVWAGLNAPARAAEVIAPAAGTGEVVINEVAWMGTGASYADEWIELYNTNAAAISLDGWHLVDDDNTDIALSGIISPYGYYLIERGGDDTISDVPADWTGSFGSGLSDGGEVLTLTNHLGVVVDTANAENGGSWPAGANNPDYSMERIDPTAADTDANWDTNDGITRNGLDANGAPINGTPKCRNSAASPAADLVVVKSGPADALPGQQITYTIRLRNAGNILATGVVVTDVLPPGLTLVTQTSPFTFSQPVPGTLVWDVGSLAISTTYSLITAVAQISPTLTGDVVNVVTATSGVTEAAAGNNTAYLITALPTVAPVLSLAKTGPSFATPGLMFTCHIALSNTGNLTATGVVVTDALPSGLTFITQTSPFTFSQPAANSLVWQVGTLPTGTVRLITLTLDAATGLSGTVVNVVTATDSAGRMAIASWSAPAVPYVRLYGLEPANYDGSGESAALINLSPHVVSLDGWSLNDDPVVGGVSFPTTATIGPGQILWLAQDAAGFYPIWGFDADWADDVVTRPVPGLEGSWPGFTDGGEEAYLLDADGRLVDGLVYGSGTPAEGWQGPAVPYHYTGYGAGQVLYRKLDQATALPIPDTDTATDWA